MTDEQFHQLITRLALIEKRLDNIEDIIKPKPVELSVDELKRTYGEFDFEKSHSGTINILFKGKLVGQLDGQDL